jgi:hypothetical protein
VDVRGVCDDDGPRRVATARKLRAVPGDVAGVAGIGCVNPAVLLVRRRRSRVGLIVRALGLQKASKDCRGRIEVELVEYGILGRRGPEPSGADAFDEHDTGGGAAGTDSGDGDGGGSDGTGGEGGGAGRNNLSNGKGGGGGGRSVKGGSSRGAGGGGGGKEGQGAGGGGGSNSSVDGSGDGSSNGNDDGDDDNDNDQITRSTGTTSTAISSASCTANNTVTYERVFCTVFVSESSKAGT